MVASCLFDKESAGTQRSSPDNVVVAMDIVGEDIKKQVVTNHGKETYGQRGTTKTTIYIGAEDGTEGWRGRFFCAFLRPCFSIHARSWRTPSEVFSNS